MMIEVDSEEFVCKPFVVGSALCLCNVVTEYTRVPTVVKRPNESIMLSTGRNFFGGGKATACSTVLHA